MRLPILPDKYYLSHFWEFLDFIETHYYEVMDDTQRAFISEFRNLSEGAQCLYVRMINRKSSIFQRSEFSKYKEIPEFANALLELEEKFFARALQECDKKNLLKHLTKTQIRKWLVKHDFLVATSLSKEELVDLALQIMDQLSILETEHGDRIVQLREEELRFLMFLFFGSIQKTLTLYTLRDLGIRQSNTLKNKFKPRFRNFEDAQTEYFFARSLDSLHEIESKEEIKSLVLKTNQLKQLPASTQHLKDQLLMSIFEQFLEEDEQLARMAFENNQHSEAREKMARYLYKTDRKEECQILLEQIIDDPRSDVELYFAEDFLDRKFNKKKIGYLTKILNQAQEMTLGDSYLKRPEEGVCEYYRKQGYQAYFTENGLWMGLFGILFWDELFESEEASIHSPFERSPRDLAGPDFYSKNQTNIEQKISMFKDGKLITAEILKSVAKNYGRLNDIFIWHANLANELVHFVKNSVSQDVGFVLRRIAQNFNFYHSGFPDLMIEKDGVLKFIEVKAEGDILRPKQLAKMRLLREADFDVEVLRVQWQVDPNQVYVVVDVETTGGSANTNRITEIGAVKIQNGMVIDEFQTLINPEVSIPAFITKITGITNDMVADAPRFSGVAPRLLQFMDNAIFVAHNVKFDYSFMKQEFFRLGIDFVRTQLCTCSGMRKLYPGISSYSLKNLAAHFNISLDQHHRAMCDAKAASELLLIINQKRNSQREKIGFNKLSGSPSL